MQRSLPFHVEEISCFDYNRSHLKQHNISMAIPLSSTFRISKEVLSQEVSGETVLLDLQSESYFGLDAVGTRIWQLLQEENHLQQLFDTMLEEYDVDEKQLQKDLNALLEKLIDEKLITIESAAE